MKKKRIVVAVDRCIEEAFDSGRTFAWAAHIDVVEPDQFEGIQSVSSVFAQFVFISES